MARHAVTLVLFALVFSCNLLEKTADGEPCDNDSECDSRACETICIRPDCGSDSDCLDGWRCEYDDGNFFGFGDGSACQATCGSCPSTQHCGRLTQGVSDLCQPGPLRALTLSGPTTVALDSEATFEARGAENLPQLTWYLDASNAERKESIYLGAERTLNVTPWDTRSFVPGRYTLFAVAHDVNDRSKGTAEGELEIELR
ncbi:MAG: hypothetical protein EOP08_15425 [Proteobacteria bacterium]|nr:MAG: hypothetical protein EOP08_15425 [Pseudomonadota bacterium]